MCWCLSIIEQSVIVFEYARQSKTHLAPSYFSNRMKILKHSDSKVLPLLPAASDAHPASNIRVAVYRAICPET